MKYECDIVKDLMPLYVDDVLSENSKKFVEDHINSCESCKKYYEKLSSEIKIPVSKEVRFSDLRPIEYLKSNLSKKIIKKVLATVLAVGLCVGAFIFATLYKLPVDPQMMDFYVNDNNLRMEYQEKGDILFSVGQSWGDDSKVWTIHLYQTPWERYIAPLYRKENYTFDFMRLYEVDKLYDSNGNILWEKDNK
ncbi:zf-HC2 domain-containing protein [uncultured Anaerococcus sp.]|uniref:zf-HC2 domain-containing protein n=1 Tax=uncultured Anaerococcus sp. TaxID=293428 RepID=UPI0025ECCFBB|nr:zf-HC2 domain-containing protein [uncultured Anaerococcus sp.]